MLRICGLGLFVALSRRLRKGCGPFLVMSLPFTDQVLAFAYECCQRAIAFGPPAGHLHKGGSSLRTLRPLRGTKGLFGEANGSWPVAFRLSMGCLYEGQELGLAAKAIAHREDGAPGRPGCRNLLP